jgi:cytochrome c-type biogenesis protein CcmE
MKSMKTKIIAAFIVVAGAATYLAFAGMQEGWVYYVDVDEFVEQTRYHDQRVRICGLVSESDFECLPGHLRATFNVEGTRQSVPVVYSGVIPQQFKPGAQVVIEGQRDDSGVFQASVLMTKCASKYQAEEHAKRLQD